MYYFPMLNLLHHRQENGEEERVSLPLSQWEILINALKDELSESEENSVKKIYIQQIQQYLDVLEEREWQSLSAASMERIILMATKN